MVWYANYDGELEITPKPENGIIERIIASARIELGTNLGLDCTDMPSIFKFDDCIENGLLKSCIGHINVLLRNLDRYYNTKHEITGFVRIRPDGYTILKTGYDPSLDMLLVIKNVWYVVKDPHKMHVITFKEKQYTIVDNSKALESLESLESFESFESLKSLESSKLAEHKIKLISV